MTRSLSKKNVNVKSSWNHTQTHKRAIKDKGNMFHISDCEICKRTNVCVISVTVEMDYGIDDELFSTA